MRELRGARAILLMGSIARAALMTEAELERERERYAEDEKGESGKGAGEKGLMKSRGFPSSVRLFGREIPILATVNPAHVLRQRRWTSLYRSDVAKCARMAQGRLQWEEPDMVFFPSADRLRELLTAFDVSGRPVAYDVETRPGDDCKFDACTDVLRCIGIGTDRLLTCVPFESVTRDRQFYSLEERRRVDEILLNYFGDPSKSICAHHEKYDREVMEQHRWATGEQFRMGRKVFDTIIGHHVVWSELPHDLGFLVAQYTDAPQHKNVDHDRWVSDYELHKYCMFDVGHTSYLAEKLATDDRLRSQSACFQKDLQLSEFCRGLHRIGVHMDVQKRDLHYYRLGGEMDEKRIEARKRAVVGLPKDATRGQRKLAEAINPGSDDQIRRYLFEICGITPASRKAGGETDSGEPSVNKDVLFHLIDKGLPDELEMFILSLIDYKEAQKLRGTFCTVEPLSDGRVHANWNAHVVVSGRLSCSKPNLMTVPYSMRSIYDAAPGNLLVACDKAQLEARVAAWEAQDTWQIEAFLRGEDMHVLTTAFILGKDPKDVTDKERKFGKTFKFACQYLAGKNKVRQMVRNFRDKDGSRPFRGFTKDKAELTFKNFWKQHVAIDKYHEENRKYFAKFGYLFEPGHFRRRYFLDGASDDEGKEDLANYPIQSRSAADVNDATFRLLEEFPWGFDGPNTGIIHQMHDAIMLECREESAERVGRRMTEIMYSQIGDMPLPVDLAIGKSWGTLRDYVKAENGEWYQNPD
jgi:DNA polymerase I-like protein with 3'-5' exonuclease and polymerase domains